MARKEIDEPRRARVSISRGKRAAKISDPEARRRYIRAQGEQSDYPREMRRAGIVGTIRERIRRSRGSRSRR